MRHGLRTGKPAVPPVAVAEAYPPLETLDADLPRLSPDVRARYERLRVGLRVTGVGEGTTRSSATSA